MGYTSEETRLVASLSPNLGTHTNKAHVVLARAVRLTHPPATGPDEDITVIRMPVVEAVELALSGAMIQVQHVGLLMIGLKAAGLFRWFDFLLLPRRAAQDVIGQSLA